MRNRKKRSPAKSRKLEPAERRKRLLQFLQSDTPVWKDADHPEFKNGTAAWVRKLRRDR